MDIRFHPLKIHDIFDCHPVFFNFHATQMEVQHAALLAVILAMLFFQPADSLKNDNRPRLLELRADKAEYIENETATITAVSQLPLNIPLTCFAFKWKEAFDTPFISDNLYIYKYGNPEDAKRYNISLTANSFGRVIIEIVIRNLRLEDQRVLTLEVFNRSGKIQGVQGHIAIYVREQGAASHTTSQQGAQPFNGPTTPAPREVGL